MKPSVSRKKFKHRRGFVKEADAYALEFRVELGLQPHNALCPFDLAEYLSIPVHRLSESVAVPEQVRQHFWGVGQSVFSAVAIPYGTSREVLINDALHPNRQRSSLAHELAHVLLGHRPSLPTGDDGFRSYDRVVEKEADDLGFTLLVPRDCALHAIEGFDDLRLAAEYYGVSKDLLEYRIRKSDARRRATNRAQRRRS